MTRYLIRTHDPEQFQQAKALVDGRARVFVTSERRLFLSTGDLAPDLQEALRSAGAEVSAERPLFQAGARG